MLRPLRLTGGNTPGYSDGVAKGAEVGLLVATLVDVATDGFIIGASFAAGGETGTVLAVVRPVELLFLGVTVTSYRIAGWRRVGVTSALGLTVRRFGVLGSAPLTRASLAVLTAPCRSVRPPSSRAEELLMEAHEVDERPIATLELFGGFLTFRGIQLMGH